MPTRRELLSSGAAKVAGGALLTGGAVATLTSCTTPTATAPRSYAFLYRMWDGYTRDLVVCDASGRNQKTLVKGAFGRAAWMSDGSHLCIARGVGDDSRGTWALWVLGSSGNLLHQITRPANGVADLDPAFSPDGRYIVFNRDTIGFGAGAGLWIVQPNGAGLHFVPGGAGGITPQFSSTGQVIFYAAADGIRSIPTSGGAARVIARGAFGWQFAQPTCSPDGKWVAFIRHNSGGGDSLCYTAPGGGTVYTLHTSPTGIETPGWSSDSNTLSFVKYDGVGAEGRGSATIFRQAIGGTPTGIYRTTRPPLTDLATLA